MDFLDREQAPASSLSRFPRQGAAIEDSNLITIFKPHACRGNPKLPPTGLREQAPASPLSIFPRQARGKLSPNQLTFEKHRKTRVGQAPTSSLSRFLDRHGDRAKPHSAHFRDSSRGMGTELSPTQLTFEKHRASTAFSQSGPNGAYALTENHDACRGFPNLTRMGLILGGIRKRKHEGKATASSIIMMLSLRKKGVLG